MSCPIPHDAAPSDPRWECEFLSLAHGLVMAGAKTRLVARLTAVSLAKARVLYKVLRCAPAPSGPLVQGSPHFFVRQRGSIPAAWSLQCAIFVGCYERTAELSSTPLQRGWRLLAAFNTYLGLTQALHESSAVKRLDINQAYALLTHCGFLEAHDPAIRRKECPTCLIKYLVIAHDPPEIRRCPVCTMNAHARRLARQAASARR